MQRVDQLAKKLLTRVCKTSGGHLTVSEAVSTLRLRFGEGGRFRFLAGALLATKAAPALRIAGLAFLNAFLTSAPRAQTKLYIQAEACEAGLEPRALQEWLKYPNEEEPLTKLLREEVCKWSRHCVDVDALQGRARRAEETCRLLSKKVSTLQQQLQKIQLERLNEYNNIPGRQKVEDVTTPTPGINDEHVNSRTEVDKKMSSSAEDEGISFSERSSSPENEIINAPVLNGIENDQETTIDDVIEELRIIVKDAEEELHDWNNLNESDSKVQIADFGKTMVFTVSNSPFKKKFSPPSRARECLRNSEESARIDRGLKTNDSLKIIVPGPHQIRSENSYKEEDKESVIIPAIIHPQPPRRAPPCIIENSLFLQQHLHPVDCDLAMDQGVGHHRMVEVCVDSEHENDLLPLDDDRSESLLSASRLNCRVLSNVAKMEKINSNESINKGKEESAGIFECRRSVSDGGFKIDCLTDFEISETILDERILKKSSKNSSVNYRNGNLSNTKQYSKCNNMLQRRTERRKYLRRCQSQDHIQPQDSCSLKSRTSGQCVIEHIKKFESLNNFEDTGLRLRRSESFHQTQFYQKDSCSSQGGSDSRLLYSALDSDSNHENKHLRTTIKNFDRINDGINAMVDIVEARGHHTLLQKKLSDHDRTGASELRYNRPMGQRIRDNCHEEMENKRMDVIDDRKYTSFLETRHRGKSASVSRHQPSDSRIFAGRPHDVLGFGKNRFNAGKYSGNSHSHPQVQRQFIEKSASRHTKTGSNCNLRGKVTDIVSGLY